MDPISVTASIVALLGASAKISELLTHFIQSVKDAPKLALRTLTEVEDLTICFRQLQLFVHSEGARSRRSHSAMVTVDQLVVVLTHSVMTFSELEAVVEKLRPRTTSMINGIFKWIANENRISQLLQRLQASKTSLTLLLTTLTCTRLDEARDAMESLASVVSGVLDTGQSIRQRLEHTNIPIQLKYQSAPPALESTLFSADDDASTIRPDRVTWTDDAITTVNSSFDNRFSFEPDLRSSRVYSRIAKALNRRSDPDQISIPSSAGFSMGSSFLSGISLAEVSNISLISFPAPLGPLTKNIRSMAPQATWLPRRFHDKVLPRLPQPHVKIALLGISNAGKSTIVKQLQSMQGFKSSGAEMEEARRIIYAQLIEIFQQSSQQDEDLQPDFLSQFAAFPTSEAQKSWALLTLQQFWKSPIIRRALDSANWPSVPNNIPYIMDNIDKVLWPKEADNFDPSLCAHIMTNGLYKSTVKMEPLNYEIYDVGGTRSMRKKWFLCIKDLGSLIFVADLNAYCQKIEENPKANQLQESLLAWESITKQPCMQSIPIVLLLNKADLFERTIIQHPISAFDSEYKGGADYWKACRYMADCYIRRDGRPPGKLHCYVVDSLDNTAFQNAWRQVQEKIIYTTFKY
ncbi:MAG: hypothetical protein Q9178_002692 [Gyalolechia marmorata]